jgi:hypothetical protein
LSFLLLNNQTDTMIAYATGEVDDSSESQVLIEEYLASISMTSFNFSSMRVWLLESTYIQEDGSLVVPKGLQAAGRCISASPSDNQPCNVISDDCILVTNVLAEQAVAIGTAFGGAVSGAGCSMCCCTVALLYYRRKKNTKEYDPISTALVESTESFSAIQTENALFVERMDNPLYEG